MCLVVGGSSHNVISVAQSVRLADAPVAIEHELRWVTSTEGSSENTLEFCIQFGTREEHGRVGIVSDGEVCMSSLKSVPLRHLFHDKSPLLELSLAHQGPARAPI